MMKSLLYRLFGAGKIQEPLMAQLKSEGLLLMDEGIKGSVTYLDFRSPGRYSNWRRQWYTASIVLTRTRLLAFRYASEIINLPLADERLRRLQVSLEEGDTLCISFDPSIFHDDWSGTIEYRFRTPQAQAFIEALRAGAA